MLAGLWNDLVDWWYLQKASRCARCSYDAPRRLLHREAGFVVDCMGCDVAGLPGKTKADAVHRWNTDNRRAT